MGLDTVIPDTQIGGGADESKQVLAAVFVTLPDLGFRNVMTPATNAFGNPLNMNRPGIPGDSLV